MTLFYVVAPKFIKEGRLLWMRAPLYVNEKTHEYIFTEDDWKKVKNKKGFGRCKGLGECSPTTIEEAFFGKYKRWEPLEVKDWNAFAKNIELLMGPDTKSRMDIITKKVDFERIKFL